MVFCQNNIQIRGIILAKGLLDHSYTFWATPITIFCLMKIILGHPHTFFQITSFYHFYPRLVNTKWSRLLLWAEFQSEDYSGNLDEFKSRNYIRAIRFVWSEFINTFFDKNSAWNFFCGKWFQLLNHILLMKRMQ